MNNTNTIEPMKTEDTNTIQPIKMTKHQKYRNKLYAGGYVQLCRWIKKKDFAKVDRELKRCYPLPQKLTL